MDNSNSIYIVLLGLIIVLLGFFTQQRYRKYMIKIPRAAQTLGEKWGNKTDQNIFLRVLNTVFYLTGMTVILFGLATSVRVGLEKTPILNNIVTETPQQPDDILRSEDVFKLMNDTRKQYNLKPLNDDKRLDGIAQARLVDMINNQYYAHLNPVGKYYYDLFPEYLIKSDYSCENLDVEFTTDERVYINDWLSSQKGHRECMLNPNVTSAGYAVGIFSQSGESTVYLVVAIHTTPITNVPLQNPVSDTPVIAPVQ